jgi:hypothetical protein
MATPAEEDLWRATFAEFKRQALRSFASAVFDTTGGGWVDLGPDAAAASAAVTADWSDAWPEQQWAIAYEILLCQTPSTIKILLPGQDDLLMFVYSSTAAGKGTPPVFARRRRGTFLPENLVWGGELAAKIDWRASLLLNVVLQTQYRLAVVRCPPWEVDRLLDASLGAAGAGSRTLRVTKVVHASPSRTPVNLDQSKAAAAAPAPSYPAICFAVEDFAESFGEMTLEEPTDCYCVVLRAAAEASWGRAAVKGESKAEAAEESLEAQMRGLSVQEDAAGASGAEESGVAVFTGFISCLQLATAMRSTIESPLRVLQGASGRPHTSKVLMRGPGGVGQAEVAVTCARGGAGAAEEAQSDRKGPLTPQKALSIAKSMAKGVVEAAKAVAQMGPAPTDERLQCALMTLEMPVDALAEQILKAL